MINVALLSRWHVHADDYAHQSKQHEQLSIKKIWDENVERGRQWAQELNIPFEKDLNKILSDSEIDAVIVNTPTHLHRTVIMEAAKQNKHIFTEKVLAFTTRDCEEIYQAVENAGVELMVSLPRLTEPSYLYAQKVIENNWIGKLTTIRCRLAHDGAVIAEGETARWLPDRFFNKDETGGGALIDLGAHPIYLTSRLGGPIKALYARLKHTTHLDVDDQAVMLLEYTSGALGVIETGFLSYGSPFQLELYGTAGALIIHDEKIILKSKPLGQFDWTEPDDLPEPLPLPFDQWIHAIQNHTSPMIQKSDVIRLTQVNEVAAVSDKEKRRIELVDPI